MKEICAHHGLEGCAPLDNQADTKGLLPGKPTVTKIVVADFDFMNQLDAAIFCLDPFRRSTEMDPGTAVEIGYMKGRGVPMAGWTQDGREYPEKVGDFFEQQFGEPLTAAAANETGGTSGDLRDPDGVLVHSAGLVQNGMAHCGIELAGGHVFAHHDWHIAFEAAAMDTARQFGLEPQEPIFKENTNYMALAK